MVSSPRILSGNPPDRSQPGPDREQERNLNQTPRQNETPDQSDGASPGKATFSGKPASGGKDSAHQSAAPAPSLNGPEVDGPDVASSPTPPLLLSLGFHIILLLLIAWVVSTAPKGTGEPTDRQIGIAMVHRLPDRDRYEEVTAESEETADEATADTGSPSSAAAPPADVSPPIDLQGILSAMESTPAPESGTGIAGDSKLGGDAYGDSQASASPAEFGEQATARLFGVSGSGNRFVYVFDRSDSMNGFGGLPLRSAKRELTRSLNSLSEQQQFQIIFYNENVKPFQMAGAPMMMVAGEATNIKRAERYIESIQAFGGTKHKGALLMALRMSPDVVFFLTDAHIPRLSQLELKQIQDRAESAGATIHAIEFGSRPAPAPDSFLKDLARMNNGQYQYVDVRKLGSAPVNQAADGDQVEAQQP